MVIYGHLVEIVMYLLLRLNQFKPELVQVFRFGVEYYASIAMGTGFLVAASPFYYRNRNSGRRISTAIVFLAVTGGLLWVYFMHDIKTPAAVVCCFCFLTVVEWFGYIGFKGGCIVGCLVTGMVLFGAAIALEKYGARMLGK